MKLFIALCLFSVFCVVYSAPPFSELLDTPWMLYKRTHEKQYLSIEEENNR